MLDLVPPPSSDQLEAAGYEEIALELRALIANCPPPFIYIHDPQAPRVTSDVIAGVLGGLASQVTPSSPSASHTSTPRVFTGTVDATKCFSQRLLFEGLVHSLLDQDLEWGEGGPLWNDTAEGDLRWNENVDSFIQGLRNAFARLCSKFGGDSKGKPIEADSDGVRLVLIVNRAEKLKDSMPELLVPLARLKELARIDLCVVFISEVGWSDIKPPLGAAPDPYFVDIPPLTKENASRIIASRYPILSSEDPETYHPALRSLYTHFVGVVCDVCYLYTRDPYELQYIAAARWPGFIKPLLDENRTRVMDTDDSSGQGYDIEPPSEDTRLRLIRLFTSTFNQAFESLHPRLTNASDWALANAPNPDLLSNPPQMGKSIKVNPPNSTLGAGPLLRHLPRLSKFILVSSFLASTNPPKSDMRMFGRGLDDKKRRRRRAQTSIKPKGGVTKVPQRLLGPSPFPLDRLIAILGALLEENDSHNWLHAPELGAGGEYTDMEISRVGIFAAVQELTSSRLLHRTTKPEQIDGPPTFKCAISHELASALSRELKIPLADLLWEQM